MPRKAESVFEKYAHEYDLLTNAAAREKPHEREVQAIIEQFDPTHVLDAGCGTGLTTMLFARSGVKAIGLDRSKEMLAIAKQKYDHSGLPLSFIRSSFQKLPRKLSGKFDIVVCLANSISGVESGRELVTALKNFYGALKPGGVLVLQLLNYAAIREGEIMPVRATSANNITYLRFTERKGKQQQLYAVRIDHAHNPPAFEVFRHSFEGFTSVEISAGLTRAGFAGLRRFGSLDLAKPFRRASRDLIITARRP